MRLALTIVASLVLAAPVFGWERVDHAQQVAVGYWHAQPPCGRPLTYRADLPPDRIADAGFCEIRLDRAWYETVRGREGWPRFCTVFLHEWGHLLGWRSPTGSIHSDDPTSLMFWLPPWSVPACENP